MTFKRILAVALITVAAAATLGQFGVPMWKQHSGNSITAYTTNYEYVVLPTCPADPSILEFGAICKDIATGKILYRGTLEAIP